ncbi:MAG TPA: carboxypeptidase regulatory-like domain-containing protein [Candidatus Hydrogenedentes bacterium]|nr:carboxypeptidase regulatory-like domain-containing protein [Candidatus Hydrogenedentota bacterium]HOV74151.1 carboxypeptidase regulatory-like domain-containing protein [Candidatus Hydrogenedentota bacterium]
MNSCHAEKRLNGTTARPASAMLTILCLWILFTGTAFAFDVTGAVVGPEGKPVPGARVWLWQDYTARHVDTDAGGAFAFGGVAPRPAVLVAYQEGFSLGGHTAAVIGSGSVTLALGEAASLAIRVKNESFEPVAGAFIRHLRVSDAFDVPVSGLGTDGFPPMRSDAEGRLAIPALLKGGHVQFVVGHRDYADSHVAYLPVSDKEQTIILNSGVKLRGRVTTDNGAGVARACVTVLRTGAGAQRVAAEALTDPDGYYHVTVLPGDYFVAVAHHAYAPPRSAGISAGADEKQNVVNIVLEAPRLLSGVVQYPDGKPCPGTPVSYWIENELCAETLTRQDGRFEVGAPPVEGRLRIMPPDGYETEHRGDIRIAAENPLKLELAPVRLKALPIIEGAITGPEGQPESRVLIATRGMDPPLWALPDTEGRFRIVLRQAPPDRTVPFRAEHADRFWRVDFNATLDDPKPLQATLKPFDADPRRAETLPGDNPFTDMLDRPAPPIACDTWFNSEPLTLESLKGRVIVLLFWGGFDERSAGRNTIEELRAIHVLLKDDAEVALVGIHDGGKEPAEVRRYVEEYRIEFPVGRDAEPFRTFGAYDIHYIPQIVLIDKHGILRHVNVGDRLLELIKSLRREG